MVSYQEGLKSKKLFDKIPAGSLIGFTLDLNYLKKLDKKPRPLGLICDSAPESDAGSESDYFWELHD